MRDIDIRRALRSHLEKLHGHDRETLIIHELGLCQGNARIDVAVINGSIVGYEIKSDRDSLDRLPLQTPIYNRVFSHMFMVVSERHLTHLGVPSWWGILAAKMSIDRIILETVKEPDGNPALDKLALVQLLWRNEVIEELRSRGIPERLLRGPRRDLWRRLAEMLQINELIEAVRRRLKGREGWRSPESLSSGDGLSRSVSKNPPDPSGRPGPL